MPETADEDDVVALRERTARPGDMVQVGQHFDPRLRRIVRQQRALGPAHHQRGVAAGDHVQFQRPGALGGAQQRGVGGELGTAAFAQVMQVDTVEHDPGPWGVLAQHRQEVAGDEMATDHDRVEAVPVPAQPCRGTLDEGRVPGLDAELLQRLRVGTVVRAIGGQEHHVRAFAAQQSHQVDQAQRTGVAVGSRRGFVDHQHGGMASPDGGGIGIGLGEGLHGERLVPFLLED